MPPDEASPSSDLDRDLLLSHQGPVRVEVIDGRPVVPISVPFALQGHTFAVDLSNTSPDPVPVGPFRFEYALGSEFAIYEAALPLVSFEIGYSHLSLTPDLKQATLILKYTDTKSPSITKEANLSFSGSGEIIERLIVDVGEPDLSTAIRHINHIVADFLDGISLLKAVPISIRHIDISAPGKNFHRRYLTFPYGRQVLTEIDFKEAQSIPTRLRGAVRLFREGISSSRPPYRLLCLYRTREFVDKVRVETNLEIRAGGGVPTRSVRTLPANELTQCYFPQFVGKKVGAFLEHVENKYRLSVAHGNHDEYFNVVLDPADVRIDHRIDFTNAVLAPVVAEMIRDEAATIKSVKPMISSRTSVGKGEKEDVKKKS